MDEPGTIVVLDISDESPSAARPDLGTTRPARRRCIQLVERSPASQIHGCQARPVGVLMITVLLLSAATRVGSVDAAAVATAAEQLQYVAPVANCPAALRAACHTAPGAPGSPSAPCELCAGTHQHQLRSAGCSAAAVDAWCSGWPVGAASLSIVDGRIQPGGQL